MKTPAEAIIRRNYCRNTPSASSTTPNSGVCSPYLKQEYFLHDWWLIKVDSSSHGKRLGIGGFTSKENQGIRSFSSAPIVKRHDAVTLVTDDGITVMVHGHLNRSRSLGNGFSHEVCDHFVIGFPYYWEEFAAISVDEESEPALFAASGGILVSDAREMPTTSNAHKKNNFVDILQQSNGDNFPCSEAKMAKKQSSCQIKNVVSTRKETPLNHLGIKAKHRRRESNLGDVENPGPMTRSRARLLDK